MKRAALVSFHFRNSSYDQDKQSTSKSGENTDTRSPSIPDIRGTPLKPLEKARISFSRKQICFTKTGTALGPTDIRLSKPQIVLGEMDMFLCYEPGVIRKLKPATNNNN